MLYYFFCFRHHSVLSEGLENLSPREDLEIFTEWHRRGFHEHSTQVQCVSLIFSYFYTVSFVLVFDCTPSEDVDNLSPREDLEIFTGWHRRRTHEDFTQVECSIFHIFEMLYYFFCFRHHSVLSEGLENLSPREDLEIFTEWHRRGFHEHSTQVQCVSLIFSYFYTVSFVLVFDCTPSEDVDNLSPRWDLEIFTGWHRRRTYEDFTQVECSIFHIFEMLYYFFCFRHHSVLSEGLENLSPREDLEIFSGWHRRSTHDDFTQVECSIFHIFEMLYYFFCFRHHSVLSEGLENLSPREDLEIFSGWHRRSTHDDFTQVECSIFHIFEMLYYFFCFRHHSVLSEGLENLSPREDLEIFTEWHRRGFHEHSTLVQCVSLIPQGKGLRNFCAFRGL
uniref:uncharacterized protein LOC127068829 isoform X1 n=1 Tax=Vespula vulgaris TaxID=7454 RepID=UPI00223B9C95|nr:uncharacterized protein LOC127068829 isoform X1 [Vespula vulgaris]